MLSSSSTPPTRPSWDAFTVEYEKRVEPFTSQFAEEMLRPFFSDGGYCSDVTGSASSSDRRHEQLQQLVRCGEQLEPRVRRRLLDVGCGTGAASLLALSNGLDVTSTDVSSAMVERTKQRLADAKPTISSDIDFMSQVADGQSLPSEWSDMHNIALSNFSVIFFPDPLAGLEQMLRCLVPSTGIAVLSAWGDKEETPAFQIFSEVAKEVAPQLVDTGKPRRITGSVDSLTKLMKDAGFVDVVVLGPVVKTLVVSSPEEYYNRFALTSPPNVAMISKMDDELQTTFRNCVMETAKLRGGQEDGSVALDSAAYIAYGRRPAIDESA